MIARWYGKSYTLPMLRERCHITRTGVSMLGISDAAESIGFRSMGVKIGFDKMESEAPLPLIAHWNLEHFVVVYKIRKGKVYVSDSTGEKAVYTKQVDNFTEFCRAKSYKKNTKTNAASLFILWRMKILEKKNE
jgi:ATP-binding cassette subfamily B protein